MDTDEQLYAEGATGWRRGLYDDVRRTFRAPIVNWIFRTLAANEPELTRYLWGQVKPIFETRAFGRFSVRYRDAVLSAVEGEDGPSLPAYRRPDVELSPAEFAELRGQLATFDVVIPRLAVLFETADRALRGDPVGESFPSGVAGETRDAGEGDEADGGDGTGARGGAADRDGTDEASATDAGRATRPAAAATTAPLPDWLDADRGRPPSMAAFEGVPGGLDDTIPAIRSFHGFDEGLPSVYRCLAQWPSALRTLWADVEPILEEEAFEDAVSRVGELTADHVSALPYRPRLSPDDLRAAGFDDGTVGAVADLFETFNRGPVETVLPAVPVLAAAFDAAGARNGL